MSVLKIVGCYFCIRKFDQSKIVEFVDDGKTPLCPNCGIDAITEDIDQLVELNERGFCGQTTQAENEF